MHEHHGFIVNNVHEMLLSLKIHNYSKCQPTIYDKVIFQTEAEQLILSVYYIVFYSWKTTFYNDVWLFIFMKLHIHKHVWDPK